MLNVKHLTLLKPNNFKRQEFLPIFFCNLLSHFSLILTKICFSIECKWLYGASPNINRVMTAFSSQPLKKWIFVDFFVKVPPAPPPPQEESKCKNAKFLQWILKDDDVYLKKKSQNLKFVGILSWSKIYFTQHAVIAIWRHSAKMVKS